jgi:hypothetical protein
MRSFLFLAHKTSMVGAQPVSRSGRACGICGVGKWRGRKLYVRLSSWLIVLQPLAVREDAQFLAEVPRPSTRSTFRHVRSRRECCHLPSMLGRAHPHGLVQSS